jgi:hypothetical protein
MQLFLYYKSLLLKFSSYNRDNVNRILYELGPQAFKKCSNKQMLSGFRFFSSSNVTIRFKKKTFSQDVKQRENLAGTCISVRYNRPPDFISILCLFASGLVFPVYIVQFYNECDTHAYCASVLLLLHHVDVEAGFRFLLRGLEVSKDLVVGGLSKSLSNKTKQNIGYN